MNLFLGGLAQMVEGGLAQMVEGALCGRGRALHMGGSGINTRILQSFSSSVNQKCFQNFLPIFRKMHQFQQSL